MFNCCTNPKQNDCFYNSFALGTSNEIDNEMNWTSCINLLKINIFKINMIKANDQKSVILEQGSLFSKGQNNTSDITLQLCTVYPM